MGLLAIGLPNNRRGSVGLLALSRKRDYSCLHVDSSFLKKYAQDFLLTFGPGITGTVHNRCFGKPC